MGRRTLMLVASILIAGIGAGLIALYVNGADARAERKFAGVYVLVASHDIPAGATLDAANRESRVKPVKVPAEVAADAFRLADVVSNPGYARGPIVVGTILRPAMFTAQPQQHSELANAQGLTIQLSEADRAAGILQPGDQAAVWTVPSAPGASVRKVVASVRVVSVAGNIVGLDVDDATAQDILTARTTGDLVLTALGAPPAASPSPSPAG